MNTEQPAQLDRSKNSYSGDECVEVAADLTAIHVRDPKELSGPRLAFARAAWA